MISGSWQICFLSPERFLSWAESGFLRALRQVGQDPDLLVLDEMHCFEEWRNFRRAYIDVTEHLRSQLGTGSLLLGLSASMPCRESQAWMLELCQKFERVEGSLGRANLRLHVRAVEDESERWLTLVSALRGVSAPDSAIVYCRSRDEVDDLSRWLRSFGIPALAFHAGLPAEEREQRVLAFRRGLLRVVCATSAFGMGIDYPRVTRVIHFSLPRSLEAYWQEVGRAGRGGMVAHGIALWRRSEIARALAMDSEGKERFFTLWRAWAGRLCRKSVIAVQLGLSEEKCGSCDVCGEESFWRNSPLEPSQRDPWWIEPEAELEKWLKNRCQEYSEAGKHKNSNLTRCLLPQKKYLNGKSLDGF